jgi:hypothetical protein
MRAEENTQFYYTTKEVGMKVENQLFRVEKLLKQLQILREKQHSTSTTLENVTDFIKYDLEETFDLLTQYSDVLRGIEQ